MKKSIRGLVLIGTIGLAAGAQAVVVNPRGQGQALIFPYYTTAAGNTTLLTLTNHSDTSKVIRLRWAEGENGRTAAQLDVYLGLYDSWTGAVFDRGAGEAPGLLTTDLSCTHPAIVESTTLPRLPDGRRYIPLGPAITDDAGSDTPERLREGFVEALELASVKRPTATSVAIEPRQQVPRNCAVITAAWTAPGGYWVVDPLRDLANPTGGLSGELSIVNVANGTIFSASAVALEDYRADPQDLPRGTRASVAMNGVLPGNPSLMVHALSDPATQVARAHVVADGKPLVLSYDAPGRAVDALSAALMASELEGPYEESPALGARTSFVLTHPTRALYTDSAQSGSAAPVAPFVDTFRGVRLPSDGMRTAFWLLNRESLIVERSYEDGCGFPCPPVPAARLPGTAVEVLAIGGAPDAMLGTRLHGDIGFPGIAAGEGVRPQQGQGFLRLNLRRPMATTTHTLLRPSREGHQLRGLPAIGLRLINYVNANAAPGVLANYSSALPMTAKVQCVGANDAVCVPQAD